MIDEEKLLKRLINAHIPLPPIDGDNGYLEIGYNAGLLKAQEIVKELTQDVSFKRPTNFERIMSFSTEPLDMLKLAIKEDRARKQKSRIELKPCPFCGKSPTLQYYNERGETLSVDMEETPENIVYAYVSCRNCGIDFTFDRADTAKEVIELWNKRKIQNPINKTE